MNCIVDVTARICGCLTVQCVEAARRWRRGAPQTVSPDNKSNKLAEVILVQAAGTASVNGIFFRTSIHAAGYRRTYMSANGQHGLVFAEAMQGCPRGWYITVRATEEGMYYNPLQDSEHGVPCSGWIRYRGPYASAGMEPAPNVTRPTETPVFMQQIAISKAGSVEVNGTYSPRAMGWGWMWSNDKCPNIIISWYHDYEGLPPRYYISDLHENETALYYGDSASMDALPKEGHVYTGPLSKPGYLPVPQFSQQIEKPEIFETLLSVSNAGSTEVNGIYVPEFGVNGWRFVHESRGQYLLSWYPGYRGQPPRYYLSDGSQGEAALYYGDAPSRLQLPEVFDMYNGPDAAYSRWPAPSVRSEAYFMVTVSCKTTAAGDNVVQCTSLSGEVISNFTTSQDKALSVGDIRKSVSVAVNKPASLLKLVTTDASLLEGSDDQTLQEALSQCTGC